MSRRLACLGLVAALGLATGCVDRRFVFESDPPGSMVEINGKPIGPAPGEAAFTYYGTYQFRFIRDGYDTLTCTEKINPPWYEFFPLEFVAENLLPFTIHDLHYIRKPLPPMVVIPPEDILRRADQLRAQGQSIGTAPLVTPAPSVTPVTVPPPGPANPGLAAPQPAGTPVPPPPPPPPLTNLPKQTGAAP
jgi:hypothetical protein